MGQKCQIVLGDICTPETAEKFAAAAEEWGGLDILVNNAGILDRDGTLQTTPETFDHIIQVNLVSVFRITQKLLQALCESKGCIVNITSSASRAPHPNANPAYGASKAGLTALTRQWALEFAPQGVRINAVQCGPHRDGYVPELDARIPRKGDVGSTFASSRNTLGRGAVCRVPCK